MWDGLFVSDASQTSIRGPMVGSRMVTPGGRCRAVTLTFLPTRRVILGEDSGLWALPLPHT